MNSINAYHPEFINQWIYKDYEINLYNHNDQLDYQVIKQGSGCVSEGNVPLGNRNLNSMIKILKDCEVVVNKRDVPQFMQCYNTWQPSTSKISLLRSKSGVLWHINDVPKNQLLPFDVIIPSKKCHSITTQIIDEIKKSSNEKSISQLSKDFKISRIINISTEINSDEEDIKNFKDKFYSDSSRKDLYPLDSLIRPMVAGIKKAPDTFRIGIIKGAARRFLLEDQIKNSQITYDLSMGSKINWLTNYIQKIIALRRGLLPLSPNRSLAYVDYFISRSSLTEALFNPTPSNISLAVFFQVLPGIIDTATDIYSTVKEYAEDSKKIEILKNRICRLKKISENSVPVEPDLDFEKNLGIEIEPLSVQSDIDKRILVSKYTWAITLVTYKGWCGNHAQLVIEGLNDGFYDKLDPGAKFTHLVDIDNYVIQSRLVSNLKFERRSEIWMRPSHLVKKMIIDIQAQEPKELNLLGRRTIVPKIIDNIGGDNDNCLTYLQENLKIAEVFLKEKPVDSLVALATFYTEKPEYYNDITPTIEI